jgi:hypothetical protein
MVTSCGGNVGKDRNINIANRSFDDVEIPIFGKDTKNKNCIRQEIKFHYSCCKRIP